MINTYGLLKQVGKYTAHVICNNDLGKYLRELYYIGNYKCKKLLPPMNGYHITVNDSRIDKLKIEEQIVRFDIILDLQTNGNAWWYPVISKDLEEIRSKAGLSPIPYIDFHYCVGYEREGKDEW